jgi:3-hydroxybutyryl-CoA dehydrogenase
MDQEQIKTVAVIGMGAMGSQIAQVLAYVGGYKVNVTDVKPEIIGSGMQNIKNNLEKFYLEKGKINKEQYDDIIARILPKISIPESVKNADFMIEAAYESLAVKQEIFTQADTAAPSHTILATNTSYLNVTDIAVTTKRPDKVIGMHFFNPVTLMKLVEINKGPLTSKESIEGASSVVKKMGKEFIVCNDFSFGFIANRAYTAMAIEAVQMVWERVAPPDEIDKALKLGYNLPMGPLELGDFTGVWIILASIEKESIKSLGPVKGPLHPLLRMMVRAGYTGGRGKKGIYDFYKDTMMK